MDLRLSEDIIIMSGLKSLKTLDEFLTPQQRKGVEIRTNELMEKVMRVKPGHKVGDEAKGLDIKPGI